MAREELAGKRWKKWEFGAFLLGISGWDCVIKCGNEHLEYDGDLELLSDEEKQEMDQEFPPEQEENLDCV